jgi:DNA-binding NarL/FixJ family response regulator
MPTVFAIHARASTHALVSRAVEVLPQAELAGRSSSVVEALRVFDTLAPDAVTVDVRLPDGDGIDLAQRLRARNPALYVILFGPAERPGPLRRAARAGMLAYVPDDATLAQVATAIGSCLAGQASLPSTMRSAVVRQSAAADLSRRELEVDRLLRNGLRAGEIAERLQLSQSTVRTYVARARAKRGTNEPTFRGRTSSGPDDASGSHLNSRGRPEA